MKKKICVLGLGYIGLPTAGMFATHGYEVVGVDVNKRVVDILNNGDIHIHEPGLKTLVRAGINSGNLRAVMKPEPADVFILAVPTPLIEAEESEHSPLSTDKQPLADLNYIKLAAEAIVPVLQPNNLIILESTVPPCTTQDVLVPILECSGLKVHEDVIPTAVSHSNGRVYSESQPSNAIYVAHCPERVLPGHILEELVHNDRVIGGMCQRATKMAQEIYAIFVEGKILLTNATTAELVKLMENTYRDVNIALANEFAQVAEQIGINVFEAITMANHHPRVNILTPGPGVGGHCIAVDPWFIVQAASTITPLIQTARQINDDMPRHVVALVEQALGKGIDIEKKRVACLGLAYKANVDDVRESPAVKVVDLLQSEGFDIRAYDPHVLPATVPGQVDSLATAVEGADLLLILTDHNEFSQLTPQTLSRFTGQFIIDTRNSFDPELWQKAGKEIWQIGHLPKKTRNKADLG